MSGPWMGTITELGIRLADLCERHAEWSRATFGNDQERGPNGPLLHLEKEAAEARLADDMDSFSEEMADCLLLVLDAARRGGIKPMQLLDAALAKVEVNKRRTWPKASPDQPVEHTR